MGYSFFRLIPTFLYKGQSFVKKGVDNFSNKALFFDDGSIWCMNSKIIGGIVLLVVVALGLFFVFKMQKNEIEIPSVTTSPQVEALQPAGTSTVAASAPVAPKPVTTKIYTNKTFGYSFSYPIDWVLEPETSVMDAQNNMPSIVSVHDTRPFSPQRFSVTINRKERTIQNQAPKKESVTVGGQSVTAYMFPDGLDCKPTKTDPDCSFFIIPIQRGGVWYEISVANEAATLDKYRAILASFVFTK